METSIQIEVRSTEIDVLGHVNNAKYLEYLEWGREDWYNRIGLPFEAFSEMGVGTVTVNININYRKEARLGEADHPDASLRRRAALSWNRSSTTSGSGWRTPG